MVGGWCGGGGRGVEQEVRKEGNECRRWPQRPPSRLGPLPAAKQSNALLILITEMILIGAADPDHSASLQGGPPLRGGWGWRAGGGEGVEAHGLSSTTTTTTACLPTPPTSSSSSPPLKATFPEGPFHLSVFNYVKWIPREEKEKWWRW